MSIELSDEISGHVNGALAAGHPMIVATVDADGTPKLSFRGSIQALSGDQLGFWARNAEGTTLASIRANPNVALMFRNPTGPVILQFYGRAREATGAERDRVFDLSPEIERKQDPERKGVGLVIDLDRVEGVLGRDAEGNYRPVRMRRD
jgi:hypothetical protein